MANNLKQHMAATHFNDAANHRTMAEDFRKDAKLHRRAAKEAKDDVSKCWHEDMAAHCETKADNHEAMAVRADEKCAECQKTTDTDEMGAFLMPTNVSKIALRREDLKDNPMGKSVPSFMVERAGQPTPKDREKGAAQIPVELIHLREVLSPPKDEGIALEADARV